MHHSYTVPIGGVWQESRVCPKCGSNKSREVPDDEVEIETIMSALDWWLGNRAGRAQRMHRTDLCEFVCILTEHHETVATGKGRESWTAIERALVAVSRGRIADGVDDAFDALEWGADG